MDRALSVFVMALLLGVGQQATAETGDVDGDGRITMGDVVHLVRGSQPAPGSLAGFSLLPCPEENPDNWHIWGLIYLESLRRMAENPLPLWMDPWKSTSPRADPLPDPRVRITLLDTLVNVDNDEAEVRMLLGLDDVVLNGLSLLVEVEGVHCALPAMDPIIYLGWHGYGGSTFIPQLSEIPIKLSLAGFLVTNGAFALSYASFGPYPPIAGNRDYNVSFKCRVAADSPAGTYAIKVSPLSQAVLSSGEVVNPTIVNNAAFVVPQDVVADWDGGVPPLVVRQDQALIEGIVKLRVTSAEGRPGDVVSVRVQMKTEVPLNNLTYRVQWPSDLLKCAEQTKVLWSNPEDGIVYTDRICGCLSEDPSGIGDQEAEFKLGAWGDVNTSYPERPLEYFKPLNEWVDVAEVSLKISPSAAGNQSIPLLFQRFDYTAYRTGIGLYLPPNAEFGPYAMAPQHWCGDEDWPDQPLWNYTVDYEDGVVKVLGDKPPDPPPVVDAGIEFVIESVEGKPGDLLEIPVFARAEKALSLLRLAVGYNPDALEISEVNVGVRSGRTGELSWVTAERRLIAVARECVFEPVIECWWGIPWRIDFLDTEAGTAVIDVRTSGPSGGLVEDYPGEELVEVLRLRARVLGSGLAPQVVIAAQDVAYREGAIESKLRSGGFLQVPDQATFAEASDYVAGSVTVEGRSFLRGDSNVDGRIDMTDPIGILLFLFVGGEKPGCFDGADADDTGDISITDAVVLLRRLFMGGEMLPPPYPDCGVDPSVDALDCRKGCQ